MLHDDAAPKIERAARSGATGPELVAIVLAELGIVDEWAVPCPGTEANCRTQLWSREQAEDYARTRGGVVEHRLAAPWRPL